MKKVTRFLAAWESVTGKTVPGLVDRVLGRKEEVMAEEQRVALPKDEKKAGTILMGMTRDTGQPPFWAPTRSFFLPDNVRKDEVAVAIITEESFKMGYIELKYHDGTMVSLRTQDLYMGEAVMPGEITQKWLRVKSGEKDLRGVLHEKRR